MGLLGLLQHKLVELAWREDDELFYLSAPSSLLAFRLLFAASMPLELFNTPSSPTCWRLGALTAVGAVCANAAFRGRLLPPVRTSPLTAAAAFYTSWTAVCLGFNKLACRRRRMCPAEAARAATPRAAAERVRLEDLSATEFSRRVDAGVPFVIEGFDRLPELRGKLGLEGLVSLLGHLPVGPGKIDWANDAADSRETAEAWSSLPGGVPTLRDVCQMLRERAEAGAPTNMRVHGLSAPPPLDEAYEHPRSLYDSLPVRRGDNHLYVGAQARWPRPWVARARARPARLHRRPHRPHRLGQGASVLVHWDQEQNHNLHVVLAGTRRIVLTPCSQSHRMYSLPATSNYSALGFTAGAPDAADFPEAARALSYEVVLSEGRGVLHARALLALHRVPHAERCAHDGLLHVPRRAAARARAEANHRVHAPARARVASRAAVLRSQPRVHGVGGGDRGEPARGQSASLTRITRVPGCRPTR